MTQNLPLVSVIVPSYNHELYLKQRIDSIINQTFQDYEVILLDDCSTDNSADVLQTYTNHQKVSHVVINDTNSGSPFGMWQNGINLSKGEYIWIAESDDFAEPDFLKYMTQALNDDDTISLAYTDSKIIDTEGNALGFWHENKNSFFKTDRWSKNHQNDGIDEIIDYLLYKVTINNVSAVLFRKQQLQMIDFDVLVKFKNAGDLFTYFNILLKGNISYVASPLNNYRTHSMNATKINTKSGAFYIDALKCYKNIIGTMLEESDNIRNRAKLIKASNFVIRRFGFKLIDNGYLKELESFIKDIKEYNFLSRLNAVKLLCLYRVYSISSGKIKNACKTIIRANLVKTIS